MKQKKHKVKTEARYETETEPNEYNLTELKGPDHDWSFDTRGKLTLDSPDLT